MSISGKYDLKAHRLRLRTVIRLGITRAVTRVTPDGSADSVINRLCDVFAEVGDPATHRLDFRVSKFMHFTHDFPPQKTLKPPIATATGTAIRVRGHVEAERLGGLST
jgi:hypothetical protein